MLIVYTQAGTDLMGTFGLTSIGGHAAIAVLSTRSKVYISWVTQPGAHGLRYELDRFSKAGWSDPVYRVQLPTVEDGVSSRLSAEKALGWWDKGIYREAEAHLAEWNMQRPAGRDLRSALTAKYNCAEIVRKLLMAAGAEQYNPSWSDAWTPDNVARLASFLHRRIGDELQQAGEAWPAEVAPATFFASDTLAGRNVHPWPKKPCAAAPN